MTASRTPRLYPLPLLALLIATPWAYADSGQRSHQHGHGLLQVAIEGNTLDIHFQAPAASLTGFEHAPENPGQEQKVDETLEWLRTTPLATLTTGDCQVARASVLSSQPRQEEQGHGHDTGHHHHNDKAAHSDYEISQSVSCAGPGSRLHSPLPDRFSLLETLRLEWVSRGGQGAAQLTRESPEVVIRAE